MGNRRGESGLRRGLLSVMSGGKGQHAGAPGFQAAFDVRARSGRLRVFAGGPESTGLGDPFDALVQDHRSIPVRPRRVAVRIVGRGFLRRQGEAELREAATHAVRPSAQMPIHPRRRGGGVRGFGAGRPARHGRQRQRVRCCGFQRLVHVGVDQGVSLGQGRAEQRVHHGRLRPFHRRRLGGAAAAPPGLGR